MPYLLAFLGLILAGYFFRKALTALIGMIVVVIAIAGACVITFGASVLLLDRSARVSLPLDFGVLLDPFIFTSQRFSGQVGSSQVQRPAIKSATFFGTPHSVVCQADCGTSKPLRYLVLR